MVSPKRRPDNEKNSELKKRMKGRRAKRGESEMSEGERREEEGPGKGGLIPGRAEREKWERD